MASVAPLSHWPLDGEVIHGRSLAVVHSSLLSFYRQRRLCAFEYFYEHRHDILVMPSEDMLSALKA